MALGPFARVLTQVVITAGGAIGRAVANAWKEAAARGAANPTALSAALSRRMTAKEAAQILELDVNTATSEKVKERAAQIVKANQPVDDFLGSPYIQRRVENAEAVLKESLPQGPPSK